MFILCTVCQDADKSGPPMPPATTCVPGVLALRQWAATLPPPGSCSVCRQIWPLPHNVCWLHSDEPSMYSNQGFCFYKVIQYYFLLMIRTQDFNDYQRLEDETQSFFQSVFMDAFRNVFSWWFLYKELLN